jgi:hypothetical protein
MYNQDIYKIVNQLLRIQYKLEEDYIDDDESGGRNRRVIGRKLQSIRKAVKQLKGY